MDVCATLDESVLNNGRIILLLAGLTRLKNHFVQHLIAFCSRPEATSDVISGSFVRPVVAHNRVKFGDPHLQISREIPSEAV